MYKAVVIEYSPKAEDMAKKIEEKANEMSEEGLDLITMSVTGSAKAILATFRTTSVAKSIVCVTKFLRAPM